MADLPGHKWVVTGIVNAGKSRFFKYRCRKCDQSTLNGIPLTKRAMKCERSPILR